MTSASSWVVRISSLFCLASLQVEEGTSSWPVMNNDCLHFLIVKWLSSESQIRLISWILVLLDFKVISLGGSVVSSVIIQACGDDCLGVSTLFVLLCCSPCSDQRWGRLCCAEGTLRCIEQKSQQNLRLLLLWASVHGTKQRTHQWQLHLILCFSLKFRLWACFSKKTCWKGICFLLWLWTSRVESDSRSKST